MPESCVDALRVDYSSEEYYSGLKNILDRLQQMERVGVFCGMRDTIERFKANCAL